jgi:antitoxin CptB
MPMNQSGQENPPEDSITRRKRLRFRSWHRGSKEADILLGNFADKVLPTFSEAELDLYEDIIREPDSDIVSWITGGKEPPARLQNHVMKRLQMLNYVDITS